ncbi:MAG: hypothetical protein ACM3VS_03550, partial [Candidatus Dadabacteria bacterium]
MTTNTPPSSSLNSILSLQPLVGVLRKMIADGMPGAKKLYKELLDELESIPELMKPIENLSV